MNNLTNRVKDDLKHLCRELKYCQSINTRISTATVAR